jgi:predicted metal-binding membrane protein
MRAVTTTTTDHSPAHPGAGEALPVVVLIALATGCWLVTANRMEGMDMGPGTDLGGLGWFAGVWATMMAAMMLPSLAPMGLACAGAVRQVAGAGRARATAATLLFAAGFLLPWLTAGLGAYALIEGVRSLDLGVLAWDDAGRYVAGGVIVGAAIYELTPVKATCLRHCREPRLVLEGLRPGPLGGWLAGIEHGGFCVGCCWALMAALFALGVMSVGWMVAIAGLIAAEKLLPRSSLVSVGVVLVLAVLGASVAFAPNRVPGLTVPDSPERMAAMGDAGRDSGTSGDAGRNPLSNKLGQ